MGSLWKGKHQIVMFSMPGEMRRFLEGYRGQNLWFEFFPERLLPPEYDVLQSAAASFVGLGKCQLQLRFASPSWISPRKQLRQNVTGLQRLTCKLVLLKMIKKAIPDMKKYTERLLCLGNTCIVLALLVETSLCISEANIQIQFNFYCLYSGPVEYLTAKIYLLWLQLIMFF